MKSLIAGILIFVIAYGVAYSLFSLPKKENSFQYKESDIYKPKVYDEYGFEMQNGQRSGISICYKNADDNYQANWSSACASDGKGPDCKLSANIATVLENRLNSDKDRCIKAF